MSYYTDLGLLPTASMEDIENAYKNLIDCETDVNIKNNLGKAHTTLTDYTSRTKYDAIIKTDSDNVIGYNNNEFQNFSNTEHNELNLDENYNVMEDNNISENIKILDYLKQEFMRLNMRLEKIEKYIYKNENVSQNNFYKERKKINTKFIKGKKVVNINTEINNNGKSCVKNKTITYDEDGNELITYKIKNIKKPKKNI